MDDEHRESFEVRWDRLKQHLDEAKRERTRQFRYSLASFLIATTATGATIGCIVRIHETEEAKVLALVAVLVLYVVATGAGLVLYLQHLDQDVPRSSCGTKYRPSRQNAARSASEVATTDPGPDLDAAADLPDG